MQNFYTKPDADFVSGSANFASLISSSPSTYGLVAGQATAFGALNTALQDAWELVTNPSTRTPVAIQQKDACRRSVRQNAILLSRIIYATSTVTDAQLTALGLKPRPVRTPRPVPATPPVVEVKSVVGRIITIRVHDGETSTKRAKAFGAVSAGIFTYVGPVAPEDPTLYTFQGIATRSTAEIEVPMSVPSGATLWISAMWYTARGQASLAGAPISTIVQGGAALPLAA